MKASHSLVGAVFQQKNTKGFSTVLQSYSPTVLPCRTFSPTVLQSYTVGPTVLQSYPYAARVYYSSKLVILLDHISTDKHTVSLILLIFSFPLLLGQNEMISENQIQSIISYPTLCEMVYQVFCNSVLIFVAALPCV